jgi:lysophospholipid acyltransferase (LPLAT)-like uncharacterized protein
MFVEICMTNGKGGSSLFRHRVGSFLGKSMDTDRISTLWDLPHPEKYGVDLGPAADSEFKRSRRLILWLGLHLAWGVVFRFYRSSRIGIIGKDLEDELIARGKGIIYAHWHRYAQFYFFHAGHKRHVMMISPKLGGEYGARCMDKVGVLSVRGSSKKMSKEGKLRYRGGREALSAMVGLIKEEGFHAGITVDGPKGPALRMKAGAIHLARDTGSPILVLSAAARPHLRLPGWDRMWMPLPFSRIVYFFSGPFYVPEDANDDQEEEIRLHVEAHMMEMAVKAERYWRDEDTRTGLPVPLWQGDRQGRASG